MLEELKLAGLWGRNRAVTATRADLAVCFSYLCYLSTEKTLLVKGKQIPFHCVFFLLGFPTLMNENSSGEALIGFDTTNTAVMEAGFSARESDDLTSCLNEISKFKVL